LLTEVYEKISDGQIEQGMADLLPLLRTARMKSNPEAWASFAQQCLEHPLRELLHQDPFTFRAFSKPRGYAGDAVMLDYIYGREEGWSAPEETSELGRQVFEFTTRSNACEGVRARRGFMADVLDLLVEETPRPHVLSIASGHLREALLSAAVKRRKMGRLVAFDADAKSLEVVERCYGNHGVTPMLGSVRQLLTGKLKLGQFDLVYSTGLFDYVPLSTGQRLTSIMFDMLRPRGRILVANFLPGILDVGYMESYMGWQLIYRTRQEMLQLSLEIPQSEIRNIQIFAEENQNIIFLEITRR
jgi:extracellular factor (EF) 3-hydroxypalmitic acid methyl ester biosynthesis protein